MKPHDISQGVWDAAEKAMSRIGDGDWLGYEVQEDIARSILAERDACAALADDHSQILRGNFDRSSAIAVEGVAPAIRSRP